MEIKGILVTMLVPMSDHIANGGEKILGNASSIKQRPDGRVYISGQKQRHALFSAMERLNFEDSKRNGTYVSNGDGVTTVIEKDLRADLGGFLQTKKEHYSGRRTAPLSATPAVAYNELRASVDGDAAKTGSEVGRDLLIRLKVNQGGDRDQALATREYSQEDLMLMNFFVDVGAVSIRKRFTYIDEMHLDTEYVKHVDEAERRRRIRLALEATNSLTDYANQARNAVSGEPQKVLLVFDTKLSRKAARFFRAGETEQANILKEFDKRGAKYFLGDDTSSEGMSVMDAYDAAYKFFDENTLFDPTGDAATITSEQFEKEG
ncbi:MAG: type I-PGING CRISPR-associated protein Cas7/Csp1 [Pyrinomonadaceae bacterium]